MSRKSRWGGIPLREPVRAVWGVLLCALHAACSFPGTTQQGMSRYGGQMRPPPGVVFEGNPTTGPDSAWSGSSGMNRGAPGTYALDTTKTCKDPATCAVVAGKDLEAVRQAGTSVATAAALWKLFESQQNSIEEKLEKCADQARAEVLDRHRGRFKKETPDSDECRQETQSGTGRKVTWAQRLGEEMHAAARDCADAELMALRKGRYSLEQRYRIIDLATGEKRLVTAAEEEALVNSGNAGELKGTVKPDVVIHEGDPLNAQAAYDFKFPCGEKGKPPEWSRYPKDHPFARQTQQDVYEKYIAPFVARVIPWLGVVQ